jgi:iron complex outermembrane recepter protein
MTDRFPSTMTSVCSVLAVLAAAPAHAQEAKTAAVTNEEIVVTAQRRTEKSVDVPITVTTLGRQALETANVQNLSDISVVTPSLRFDNQAAFVQPTIRGIGTAVVTSGGGANVGIYVDGFYSPNPLAADFDLLNVQSVQVLKGPQGTLFGRNTTGGAILVQSGDPGEDLKGQFKASYGRFNTVKLQGYATNKIAEGVAFDLQGQFRRGDGFVRNIISGGTHDGKYSSWSIRAGVKAQLSEAVSLLLRYTHGDIDDPTALLTNAYVDPVLGNTVANFAPPGSYTADPNSYAGTNARFFRSKNNIYQATVKADLGFSDLTSYTQYRTENVDASQDIDQIGLTIFHIGLPVYNKTISQEFLMTSKPGTALQWTAGLFYFSNRDTYRTFIDNTNATTGRIKLGGSSTTPKTLAAFADVTYEVSPSFFVTAGGRVSHDQIDNAYYIRAFSGVQTPVTAAQADAVKKTRVTPRLVLRYKPSGESSIYGSFTQGYKSALLDVGGSTGNPVLPEKVNAFEAGYKYDDRQIFFESSAFYYDYKNLQVSLFKGNPPSAQLVNAASSEIYGLEAQARYALSEQVALNAGAAWTHARYKRFDDAPIYLRCPGPGGCGGGTSFFLQTGTTLRNVTMQRAPAFTGNLGGRYKTDLAGGNLALSGNLYYSSKFFFGPSGVQFPQGAYETLSLRAQWEDPSDHYSVALYGDNVTNSRYVTQVQYNNFGIGAVWNAPVTYGIELGAKF